MVSPASGDVVVSFISGAEMLRRVEDVAPLWGAAFGRSNDAAKRYATESLPEMIGFMGFTAVIALTPTGHLAGFACGHDARPHRPWFDRVSGALDSTRHRAWLEDPFELAEVVVHPASQGRGIGTGLCQAIQDCLKDRPAPLVPYHGDHPARRFYRRLGWQVLVEDFVCVPGRRPTSILGLRGNERERSPLEAGH